MHQLSFAEVATWAPLAVGELWAQAQPEFPRGPGFYFSMVKLGFLLVAFFLWSYVCTAVQRDSDVAEFHAESANSLLLGAGILGLGMVWLCPSLWVSLLGLTLLVCCGVAAYAWQRDRRAPVPWLQPIK